MVAIEKRFNLASFEAALAELENGDEDLRLPHSIKSEAVGGVAALAQLIITWARAAGDNGNLELYAKDINDSSLYRFSQSVTGLVALNLAHKITSYYKKTEFSRKALLEKSVPFVEAMHASSLAPLRDFNRTTIPLLCIDNARQLRRPIRLYQGSGEVRSRSEFVDLLQGCYRVIGSRNHEQLGFELMVEAAQLVYEAFLNTHEHAQKNFRGDVLRRSVRGVLVGQRVVNISQLIESAGSYVPLVKYFESWRPVSPKLKQAKFMDISIFDSGSGLAQTWLYGKGQLKDGIREDNIPLEDEFNAVMCCLKKGSTTKSSFTSGNGLFRILEVVSKAGGFLRIRTGRLSLVKAFSKTNEPFDVNNLAIEDAISGGLPVQAHSWADGTTLSVLLPLNSGDA